MPSKNSVASASEPKRGEWSNAATAGVSAVPRSPGPDWSIISPLVYLYIIDYIYYIYILVDQVIDSLLFTFFAHRDNYNMYSNNNVQFPHYSMVSLLLIEELFSKTL